MDEEERLEERKVFLEEADKPPPSYYKRTLDDMPLKKQAFQPPDPNKWLEAPEFVPRTKQFTQQDTSTVDSTAFTPLTFVPFVVNPPLPPVPSMVPVPPLMSAPPPFVCPPPFVPEFASDFRRKRRRRRRHHRSADNSIRGSSTSSSRTGEDEDDDEIEDEMQLDDVVENDEIIDEQARMIESAYDKVAQSLLDVAEETLGGYSSPAVRQLDRELRSDAMTSSTVMHQLNSYKPHSSDASQTQTLSDEFDQLSFRPPMTKYGYPQFDAPRVHMTTFSSDGVTNTIIERNKRPVEEDYYEGVNITVNHFDPCDDLSLSDLENVSAPSRLERVQEALKKSQIALNAPDKVCCVVM